MILDYLYKGNIEAFNIFTKKKTKTKTSFSLEERVYGQSLPTQRTSICESSLAQNF